MLHYHCFPDKEVKEMSRGRMTKSPSLIARVARETMWLCLLCLTIIPLTGCSTRQESTDARAPSQPSAHTLTIAVLPGKDFFSQKVRYTTLADYLSRSTGMDVRIRLIANYTDACAELKANEIQAVFVGSLSYVRINSKVPLDPIARPCLKNGVSEYRGLIFTRRGSGITGDVRTWKGKRIALVNKSATSGYIFPRWYLSRREIRNFKAYFGKVIYAGSHESAVAVVLRKDADIGAAGDTEFNGMIGGNPGANRKLVVIAKSPLLPLNTLAIKKDAGTALKLQLEEALLGMQKTPQGRDALSALGAIRFIPTKDADYAPVRKMMADLGLKPSEIDLSEIGLDPIVSPSGQRLQ